MNLTCSPYSVLLKIFRFLIHCTAAMASRYPKRAKYACYIDSVPDPILVQIFAYLPFKDRYLLCRVCSKWAVTSRTPWSDVTFLNLNAVPRAMINSILSLCPQLATIEADARSILLEKKPGLSLNASVHTMRLRNASFALTWNCNSDALLPGQAELFDLLKSHFERFPKLSELSLHNVARFIVLRSDTGEEAAELVSGQNLSRNPLSLPDAVVASLRRFALIDSSIGGHSIDFAVREMRNIECLYLEGAGQSKEELYGGDIVLPQLRELCVVAVGPNFSRLATAVACGRKFPKLQVLCCASDSYIDVDSVAKLITADVALRVLIIAGKDQELSLAVERQEWQQQQGIVAPDSVQVPVTIPPRRYYPNSAAGVGQPPFPPLQIFVGGDFTKYYRFTLPLTSDVASFWRIDHPMPAYLTKPDVAAVFKDVWVAQIIRQGPENGLLPWGRPGETELFYSTSALDFC